MTRAADHASSCSTRPRTDARASPLVRRCRAGRDRARAATVADAPAIARADRRPSRGRPSAAAHARRRWHAHAPRFVVVDGRRRVVGCAELAPLAAAVAEVRSLVVDESARGHGLGSRLVEELNRCGACATASRRCARSRTTPATSSACGFSIVPHTGCPRRSRTDCIGCPLFRNCGQYAMVLPCAAARCGRRGGQRRTGDARDVRRSSAPGPTSTAQRAVAAPASVIDEPRRVPRSVDGGVTAPAGFRAAGVALRHQGAAASSTCRCSSRDAPASAAGVFTTNLAKAAPVLVSQEHLAASQRPRPRDRRQQRLRQRLHRRRRA